MDDFKRRQLTVMTDGIRTPDEESRRECLRRWDGIAKPIKGLGRLEELTARIASIQRTPDFSVDKRALVVFCADNGITQEGVTQTDSSVTAAVAAALARGSASANAMAAVADADVIPIDIGISGEVPEPGITDCKIRTGTADFLKGPAMETDDALEAVLTGIQTVSRLKDMGYDIIAAGEMGIGNSTTSAAVAAVMLGLTPEEAAGRGAGLSDEGLNRKTEVIRKGMELHDAGPKEPLNVLAALGGLDMAGICGLMLGGAIYGVPIVMDGIVSCAAALLADAIAPASRGYIIPSHEGREPVCRRTMEALGFSPVIHADLALGEGTGALLLFPMLSMAQAVYRQDTTFEDIHITPYEHFAKPDLLTIKGKQIIDSADVMPEVSSSLAAAASLKREYTLPGVSHGFRSAESFHAKRIMIQGTMSGAGKSFVTAAFCRIFRQDGYTVAPFKSQNMALNSAVTPEGLEIGRAQAMQAEAAGIEASAAMNPILLKPTGDEESQVIVRGEVACSMSATEYYDKKAALIPVIEESFKELADVYDIVVIEGAGSPVEINLKENDIVNMGMARMADAPVILVADIDRGGVFAQIVGTVELMEPDERARIKGIIINKFRGDADLLRPGIEPIEKRLGIPVLGIIPMEQIDLDEEDSLAPRLENKRITPSSGNIDVAVVRLPHISNFTDFSVLERWEGVSLSYVTDAKSLYRADLVIIPGTKNTFEDLAWVKASGLADAIKDISGSGKATVIGICGGYQMMGESLCDPEGTEGAKGAAMQGLGLLPVTTVFTGKKTRSRSSGVMTEEAAGSLECGGDEGLTDEGDTAAYHTLEGYEIHMGKTSLSNDRDGDGGFPFLTFPDGSTDGCVRADGLCMGTYLHGLFDNIRFTGHILKRAGAKKGITAAEPDEDVRDYRERQYDRLADIVRCSVDMDAVYRILDGSTVRQGEKRHD